jgi:hypothetical protein
MGQFLSALESIQPAAHWRRAVGRFTLATQLRTVLVSRRLVLLLFSDSSRSFCAKFNVCNCAWLIAARGV